MSKLDHRPTSGCSRSRRMPALSLRARFENIIAATRRAGHVVQTTWRMVVRYWDAFAWSVGFKMIAVDQTLRWACCFHDEELIVFGRWDFGWALQSD